jgi:hypothetical protein
VKGETMIKIITEEYDKDGKLIKRVTEERNEETKTVPYYPYYPGHNPDWYNPNWWKPQVWYTTGTSTTAYLKSETPEEQFKQEHY